MDDLPISAQLTIAQDPDADALLSADPFALLMGMLLDQQFPMERAFAGPLKISQRFGTVDPGAIAAADPDTFADLCATPPAVHRYGRSMAGRIQALATSWSTNTAGMPLPSGPMLHRRRTPRAIARSPGSGEQKAKIFLALLAKQLGGGTEGLDEGRRRLREEGYRSVADVVDADSLQQVRDFKKAAKAAAKAQG